MNTQKHGSKKRHIGPGVISSGVAAVVGAVIGFASATLVWWLL